MFNSSFETFIRCYGSILKILLIKLIYCIVFFLESNLSNLTSKKEKFVDFLRNKKKTF